MYCANIFVCFNRMPVGNVSQWTMSQTQKLKYIQLFNTHDRMKKGFLTGESLLNSPLRLSCFVNMCRINYY